MGAGEAWLAFRGGGTMALRLAILMSFFTSTSADATGIKQTIGGIFTQNQTLRSFNGPYRVDRDILVEAGATLTIQTGTEMYFDPGVGIRVHGTLIAVGVQQARIKLLPYSTPIEEWPRPTVRLVDGPAASQGRLEVRFRDKWRAVCSQNTNWTVSDFHTSCRSMGFGGGGFWRWYRRNNDTRPFVLPKPECPPDATDLWNCPGLLNHNHIPLSENLCQGEDDVGVVCWGPPRFAGWESHWRGLEFVSAPYHDVLSDPDGVGTIKESLSRLEYVDIDYAGVDGVSHNATSAVRVQGIAPYINDLRIRRSGLDGVQVLATDGQVMVANSTISGCRGRGIAVVDTTDGRLFINETRVQGNFGDGVWYRQRADSHAALDFVPAASTFVSGDDSKRRRKRQSFYADATPLINFCAQHRLERDWAFPYLLEAFLPNGTTVPQLDEQLPCYVPLELPRRLPYEFNFQVMDVVNRNPSTTTSTTETELLVCRASRLRPSACDGPPLFRVPVRHRLVPQTFSTRNQGEPILVGLRHSGTSDGLVLGDVRVKLRVHATPPGFLHYGLNVSNSVVDGNGGRGLYAENVRDRLVVTNASISGNAMSGIKVHQGAANVC